MVLSVEKKYVEDTEVHLRRQHYNMFKSDAINDYVHQALKQKWGLFNLKSLPLRGEGSGGVVVAVGQGLVAKVSHPNNPKAVDALFREAYNISMLQERGAPQIPHLEKISSNGRLSPA